MKHRRFHNIETWSCSKFWFVRYLAKNLSSSLTPEPSRCFFTDTESILKLWNVFRTSPENY